MQVRWLFTIKTFVFFEYMQVLCAFGIKMLILIFWVFAGSELFPIKMFVFLSICRFEGLEVHQTCIYSKKINMLMPKVHKTCIYSKKSKVLIVKSHQTCIYSKNQKNQKPIHLCQSVAHRVWDFCFFWFFWLYAGLVTFHYRNFWFFWV